MTFAVTIVWSSVGKSLARNLINEFWICIHIGFECLIDFHSLEAFFWVLWTEFIWEITCTLVTSPQKDVKLKWEVSFCAAVSWFKVPRAQIALHCIFLVVQSYIIIRLFLDLLRAIASIVLMIALNKVGNLCGHLKNSSLTLSHLFRFGRIVSAGWDHTSSHP